MKPTYYLIWCALAGPWGRRIPALVPERSYSAKVHWRAADLHHGACGCLVCEGKLPLAAKPVVSFSPLYFGLIIFTSSHSVWHFFLPHNFLPVFFILNPIHIFCQGECIGWYARTDPQSSTSVINSDHISTTSMGKKQRSGGNLITFNLFYTINHGTSSGNSCTNHNFCSN